MVESLRQSANRANPNSLPDVFRTLNLGDMLRAMPIFLRSQTAGTTGANASQLATLGTVTLPQDAKAAIIHRCTVKASGVTNGEFSVQAYGTTPTTTQVAVAPNGDIVFLGTDLVTDADIIYQPQKGDVLGGVGGTDGQLANSSLGDTSLTLPVPTSGQMALPSGISKKAVLLMQANALKGTVTGLKIILVPATAVTATTKAALSQDAASVWWNHATDAVTSGQIDLLVQSGLGGGSDANALLEGAGDI